MNSNYNTVDQTINNNDKNQLLESSVRADSSELADSSESSRTESTEANLYNNNNNNNNNNNMHWFYLLICWQVLSIVLTGTGVFSQIISNRSINTPTFQSFLVYCCLILYLIVPLYKYLYYNEKLKVEWWKYIILAFIDVEANFLVVKAYQYTSIESVQLLDCFAIPCVMGLSYFLLKQKFSYSHYIGVFGCLIGLSLLVVSDIQSNRFGNQSSENKLLGDILTLCGASLYSISNVGQEYFVKSYDRYEYLGFMGLFGAIISSLQFTILERDAVASITGFMSWMYMGCFVLCMVIFYSLVPVLLSRSSATYMNLSLLTSDFFSVMFAIFLFDAVLVPLYFVAFSLIVFALIIYNLADIGLSIEDKKLEDKNGNYQTI